ncbi:MAG: hypothetical protein IJ281_02805 [Clostridia bacterium]|nr:hypothetical protein [Clostridia bacterium]
MKSDNKYSHIEGKRIYTHPLAYVASLLAFLSLGAVASALIDHPTKEVIGRSLDVVLLTAGVVLLLLLCERIWLRKLLCILGEDRLYFFRAAFTKYYENSPRKTTMLHCSGSLPYFAIADMKNAIRWERSRYSGSTNNKLVIIGDTFEIALIAADRSLPRKIRKKQAACPPLHTSVGTSLTLDLDQPARSGLWAEIWQAYETGAFEKLFDEYTEISLEWTFEENSVDMLDIILVRNGYEIYFDIDEESFHMDAIDTGVDTTIALADIKTLDNLYAQIQNFVRENT